jgi:hypothetical protein
MTERENPLDIDYSLRIGTSVYHVLGKRRKSQRSKYDYYVVDEKLIRSESNKKPKRPRYIVDEPNRKVKEPSRVLSPPKSAPMDIEEIKHTLEELEERFIRTMKEELQKARLEAETTQQEREKAQRAQEKRLKELFDEQKQTLSAILEQQQEQIKTTAADRIEAAVIKALESQQNQQQQAVSKEDIQGLENKLSGKIQEMVDGYKKIKIYNDLDIRALPYSDLNVRKQMQQRQESKTDAESSENRSSTKTKQAPADIFTQDQSEFSHKRDEELESQNSND